MRWKPPPPRNDPNAPHIGWRTEFRPMEVQITDMENAAFAVMIVLVTRVILAFDLNLYIPLSKVDENMARAHARDAISSQKFWFRKVSDCDTYTSLPTANVNNQQRSTDNRQPTTDNCAPTTRCLLPPLDYSLPCHFPSPITNPQNIAPPQPDDFAEKAELVRMAAAAKAAGLVDDGEEPCGPAAEGCTDEVPCFGGTGADDEYEEMSIAEILTGKGDYYPGLIPLVYGYLEHISVSETIKKQVHQYLDLIEARATGESMTNAAWIREFVTSHPEYKQDSVVSDGIAYDLCNACREIGEGKRAAPELLLPMVEKVRELNPDMAYDVPLDAAKITGDDLRQGLVQSYFSRASRRKLNKAAAAQGAGVPVSPSDWK